MDFCTFFFIRKKANCFFEEVNPPNVKILEVKGALFQILCFKKCPIKNFVKIICCILPKKYRNEAEKLEL